MANNPNQGGGVLDTSQFSNMKRPQTAEQGARIKSVAANFIFKKWGYDTSSVLKGSDINVNNFISEKTLKKDHLKFFTRLDHLCEV